MQEIELKLSKGDWVFHPRMPDWGYGKVLELLSTNKGRVFFLLGGEKKLSWHHAGLCRVGNDMESQATLNTQLTQYKASFARTLFSCGELSQGVTFTSCEAFNSKCEFCERTSESVRIYSLPPKGKICLCDVCRDKIMLETADNTAGTGQNIVKMEKKGKLKAVDGGKSKSRLKVKK